MHVTETCMQDVYALYGIIMASELMEYGTAWAILVQLIQVSEPLHYGCLSMSNRAINMWKYIHRA